MAETIRPPDLTTATGTEEEDFTGLLRSIQETSRKPLFETPLGQLGSVLGAYGAGYSGRPNPVRQRALEKRNLELRSQYQLGLLKLRINQQKQQRLRMLLELAKDIPHDSPAGIRAKFQIYNQSGLVKFTPSDIEEVAGKADAKKVLENLPKVLGGIRAGVSDQDIEAITPGASRHFDLKRLRALPRAQLEAIGGPSTEAAFSRAVSDHVKAEADTAKQGRDKRISDGSATPVDFLLQGAKTVEEIGGRLLTQATTSGIPVPPEYQSFLRAYTKEQRFKGLTGTALLAAQAASGDPQAGRALQLHKESTREDKLVGEVSHPIMNQKGEYANPQTILRDAVKAGFFSVTPKEETIVHGLPALLTMVSQLMAMSKALRDVGATRTQGGLVGAGQAIVIKATRLGGEPIGPGGQLRQFELQRTELISILRNLGEKGNQAWKGMAPGVEGMMPEAGFVPIIRQLKNLENQLKADVRQSRIPGFADQIPVKLPKLLELSDSKYQTLKARGVTDEEIEAKGDIILVK